ncbi:MAG TPA: class I tRNA ligase family protein [Candidatus Saccharimonadales bacterium]|nr:class I tRNA ligase family protein [Candidatus Saccharimonadales bacterium]
MKRYNPADIEPKWQKVWEDQQTYKADNTSKKKPYYALSMFPYPSGIGLHIGHARIYSTTDVLARFMRMQGYEVMQPFGWDSFGLPAENYAIKTGTPPQVVTKQNTDNFRTQAKHLGLSIDWSREFASTDPDYYRWTQWFFLLLHRRGLAYQKESAQFWCNECKTVLANEQVVNGCCWRHEDKPVTKKTLKQWFFKITDYADRLEADLDQVDWPEGIKSMQRNWIGRSKGAEVDFAVDGRDETIKIFTTRADTLFGAAFMVLAPEHELARTITTPEKLRDVDMYIKQAETKTDIDRMDEGQDKSGVFTGAYAINPVNGEKIPVWIADFVLGGYGTGAIFADAHDSRDVAFARQHNIALKDTIEPETGTPQQNPEFRRSIVAIVRNHKTGEVLTINWGKMGGSLFVGGGRDDEEDIIACAEREIREETGYTNIRFVAKTGTIHHNYFAASKNVARRIEAHGLLFDLVDESRQEAKLEADEQGKFTVEWLPQNEVESKVRDELHALVFTRLVKNEAYTGEGILVDSGKYSGMRSSEAREHIVADLEAQGVGKERVNYKIRDWLISRQRYWGAPIPIIHCPKDGIVPVPEDQLPVQLPELKEFQPSGDGRSPLANVRDWVEVACPTCGGPAERETDTMDGFACSSWYFLRFADPKNNSEPFSRELAEKWLPVNTYVGGAEHAVMHLLYARMWTKVMFDEGMISFQEPFTALRSQGMLLAPDGGKFSKSKGNGVDPEDVINSGYGADALRTVLMFLAPFDQKTPWSPEALGGVYRFLNRIWTIAQEVDEKAKGSDQSDDLRRSVHKAIKKVTEDMQQMGFNTAIAAVMELVNELYKHAKTQDMAQYGDDWRWAIKTTAQLIAPCAPHLAEELWQQFGGEGSVAVSEWPHFDKALLVASTITIVVQVNGKIRAKLEMPAQASEADVKSAALADDHVRQFVSGDPKKVIYVPGKLLSIVV